MWKRSVPGVSSPASAANTGGSERTVCRSASVGRADGEPPFPCAAVTTSHPRVHRPMSAEPQQVDQEAPQLKGPREALRVATQRNFGPYFLGNALSASGTWFQNLAASLLVFRLTHSAFLLGVLAFAQFIPVLVLAPWAGAAADRFDRKHLLLVTQSIAVVLSATLGALAFGGLANAWVVIVFALGLGVVSAYSAPAHRRSSARSCRTGTSRRRSRSTR